MITLFQFPRAFGIPSLSPYCVKLETWLRISGHEYNNQFLRSAHKSPSGKLPFVTLEDGASLCDSTEIIQALSLNTENPDSWLSPIQKAHAHALQSMVEEQIGSALVFSRWVDSNYRPDFISLVFSGLPLPLRIFLPWMLHKKVAKKLAAREITEARKDFVYHRAKLALQALSEQLANNPWMMGEQVSTLDACAYGFLINIQKSQYQTRLTMALDDLPNLAEYTRRMHITWFPELEKPADASTG